MTQITKRFVLNDKGVAMSVEHIPDDLLGIKAEYERITGKKWEDQFITKVEVSEDAYGLVVELTRVRDALMCLQQTWGDDDKVKQAKKLLFAREDELCRKMSL